MRGVLAAALVMSLASCGGDDQEPSRPVVRVFAAASLTDAFTEIADAFEASQGGITVELTLAASSTLVSQIEQGAAVDVLVTADEATMARAVDAGHATTPRVFGRNRLSIAVERGNPKGITGLDDLGRDDVLVALCREAVPCGSLARRALERAGIDRAPTVDAENARAVLHDVSLGEVDAGIVYVTDLEATDGVEGVDIDIAHLSELAARYTIARLSAGPAREHAQRFVSFVLGDEAGQILASHGFLPA